MGGKQGPARVRKQGQRMPDGRSASIGQLPALLTSSALQIDIMTARHPGRWRIPCPKPCWKSQAGRLGDGITHCKSPAPCASAAACRPAPAPTATDPNFACKPALSPAGVERARPESVQSCARARVALGAAPQWERGPTNSQAEQDSRSIAQAAPAQQMPGARSFLLCKLQAATALQALCCPKSDRAKQAGVMACAATARRCNLVRWPTSASWQALPRSQRAPPS